MEGLSKQNNHKWNGDIPENWLVKKLPWVCFFQEGPGLRNWQFVEQGIPVVCVTNITPKGLDFTKLKRCISEEEYHSSYKRFKVEDNDLLLASSGNSFGKICCYSGEFDYEFILNTSTIRLHSLDEKVLKTNFIKLLIESDLFQNQIKILITGAAQPNFGPSHLNQITIPVPSLQEQKLISEYLDKKTLKIDSLIEKIEKKIELLNEQKTAMINQYVTRGLDLNVEMKDSGVKGIGDIPKNWSLKKISHIVNFIGSGTTPKSNLKEYYENGEVNWLITGDLNDHEIYETSKKITLKAQEDTSLKTYPSNSLVIAMYGATIGKLGILKVKSTVNQACCVLNFDINQDIDFWFNSFLGNREYLISLGYGGGQPNISQETIKGLRLPSPPDKSEQILISKFLKKESKKINNLIKKHIKKKNLLCEYHQSLISSVVTGKIRITEDMI